MKVKKDHINPALKLESLKNDLNTLSDSMDELARAIQERNPNMHMPWIYDKEYSKMSYKFTDLKYDFEDEKDRVSEEYYNLFKTHYISIEELEEMIDVNALYIHRNILPEVSSVYFSRIIRKDVKNKRRKKIYTPLCNILYEHNVDIEKKVFISYKDLVEWFTKHAYTIDGTPLSDYLINHFITRDRDATLISTNKCKKIYRLKYDMQLKRMNRARVRIYGNDNSKPISRIPIDDKFDWHINKLMFKEEDLF